MNLFAHQREYQRCFDRIFEDFSATPEAQTEPSPEKKKSIRRRSVFSLSKQREPNVHRKSLNAITPRVAGSHEFMQCDTKAWGRFLDSKHKE